MSPLSWDLFMVGEGQSLTDRVSAAKARYREKNSEKPNTILLHPLEAKYRTSLLGLKIIPGDGTLGTLILQPGQFALGRTGGGFRTAILDPRDYFGSDPGKAGVRRWRGILKAALLLGKMGVRRQSRCYCGAEFGKAGCHLHEGIVYRNQAMGTDWQWQLYSSVNCILLCAKCNTSHQNVPSRQEVYERKCKELGKEIVDEWLESLPAKVPLQPFQIK